MLTGYIIDRYDDMADTYFNRRIIEEASHRGICILNVGCTDSIQAQDAIINRGVSLQPRTFAIMRQKTGHTKDRISALCRAQYNSLSPFSRFADKFAQRTAIRPHHLLVPKYALATTSVSVADIATIVGMPFVAKGLISSRGREVFLIGSQAEWDQLHQNFGGQKEWLVEQFIPDADGSDIRLLALRGKAVAVIRRKSSTGDFRANIALGATAAPVPITPHLEAVAADIYTQTRLDIIGIDIIQAPKGEYLCEINVAPGIQALEQATGTNVAAQIIDLIASEHI